MKNMTVIHPKPQKGNAAAKEEVKHLRVAAYCRVSTDNEEQASSYEAQIQHYEEFIKTNMVIIVIIMLKPFHSHTAYSYW